MPKTRIELQLNAAEDKIKALTKELEQTSNAFNAVITFVLDFKTEEGEAFLRCWNDGDFEACRREWPEAPKECYIGADPLFKG